MFINKNHHNMYEAVEIIQNTVGKILEAVLNIVTVIQKIVLKDVSKISDAIIQSIKNIINNENYAVGIIEYANGMKEYINSIKDNTNSILPELKKITEKDQSGAILKELKNPSGAILKELQKISHQLDTTGISKTDQLGEILKELKKISNDLNSNITSIILPEMKKILAADKSTGILEVLEKITEKEDDSEFVANKKNRITSRIPATGAVEHKHNIGLLRGKKIKLPVYINLTKGKDVTGKEGTGKLGFEFTLQYADGTEQTLSVYHELKNGLDFKGVKTIIYTIQDKPIAKIVNSILTVECDSELAELSEPSLHIIGESEEPKISVDTLNVLVGPKEEPNKSTTKLLIPEEPKKADEQILSRTYRA